LVVQFVFALLAAAMVIWFLDRIGFLSLPKRSNNAETEKYTLAGFNWNGILRLSFREPLPSPDSRSKA